MSALIFDFDDTLIFSRSDRARRLIDAIRAFGHDAFEDRLSHVWGKPFKELVVAISPTIEKTYMDFVEFYASELRSAPPRPCPGVIDTVPKLAARSSMFVHSASHSRLVRTDLETLGLLAMFDFVCGSDWQAEPKPSVKSLEPILTMIKLSRFNIDDVFYIGDTPADAIIARAAGIRFIGVEFGESPKQSFNRSEIYSLISSISELPTVLNYGLI